MPSLARVRVLTAVGVHVHHAVPLPSPPIPPMPPTPEPTQEREWQPTRRGRGIPRPAHDAIPPTSTPWPTGATSHDRLKSTLRVIPTWRNDGRTPRGRQMTATTKGGNVVRAADSTVGGTVRTVLEQRIRERRQTFEEFVAFAEVFGREHGERNAQLAAPSATRCG
jgi:hypothetical protein